LNDLEKLHIHPVLIEQPVPKADWDGLAKITRESKVKVCADESVASLEDASKAIRTKSVDAINIKFMKTGILEAQKIAKLAVKNNIELMLGSMMESPLSAVAAAHFAGGTGSFNYIDLDTPFFIRRREIQRISAVDEDTRRRIKGDTLRQAHLKPNGVYELKKIKRGIGVALDLKT